MPDFRLRKNQIIHKSHDFNKIFQKGGRLNSSHILLLFLESEQRKFGFAVSQKIKGAVKRNHAKRRLREVVRLNQHKLPENFNVILVAKPGIERAKFEILNDEFINLVKKLDSKRLQ